MLKQKASEEKLVTGVSVPEPLGLISRVNFETLRPPAWTPKKQDPRIEDSTYIV